MTTTEHKPRLHLHPDGQCLSIGFEDTPDTLLFLQPGDNWGDAARLREWTEAVGATLLPITGRKAAA